MATPTSTHNGLREYVLSADLADEIREWISDSDPDRNYHAVARLAKVSPRSISKILNAETCYSSIFLADRILTAVGSHLIHLDTVWRRPRGKCK